jgi:uncharacterized membrane protein
MGVLDIVLPLSALLCALVAGFVLAFASVVMPGIQALNDREFLRAFQVMDLVIQRNQAVFMLVWVGSVVAMVTAVALSFRYLAGTNLLLLLLSAATYLLGVQLPTVTINIPLNNGLQRLALDSLIDSDISEARVRFEDRWIKWNRIRTIFAVLACALLLALLFRL